MRPSRPAPTLLAVCAAAGAIALAGCGGDDGAGSATSTGAATSAAEGSAPAFVEASRERVEAAYAGTNGEPPREGPAPARGKSVWILSCGQSQESCSAPVAAAEEAVELLGWDATVFDGKFNPDAYAQGIRQAVAAGADGILLQAIDCPLVQQPLQEAERRGVAVVALQSADCDDLDPQAPSLFDAPIRYGTGIDEYADFVAAWAGVKADWIIADSDGKAKVLNFTESDLPTAALIGAGFAEGMKACTTCEVVDVEFTAGDLGPKLQQKAQQALLEHPDAGYVHAPYDSAVIAGIGPAVAASGRAGEIEVMGGEGYEPNLDLIREGRQQTAANVFYEDWTGWAGVDTLNRLFNGDQPVEHGIGWQLVDREHNLPESGRPKPPVDWQAAYRRAWGVD